MEEAGPPTTNPTQRRNTKGEKERNPLIFDLASISRSFTGRQFPSRAEVPVTHNSFTPLTFYVSENKVQDVLLVFEVESGARVPPCLNADTRLSWEARGKRDKEMGKSEKAWLSLVRDAFCQFFDHLPLDQWSPLCNAERKWKFNWGDYILEYLGAGFIHIPVFLD